MSQDFKNHLEDNNYKAIFERLFQAATTKAFCHYNSKQDPYFKANIILSKLYERDNKNQYSSIFDRILDFSTWNTQIQKQVNANFNPKTSGIIKHRMQIMNKVWTTLNNVINIILNYNESLSLYPMIDSNSVENQLIKIIEKMNSYQEIFKSISEYPIQANNNKYRALIDQNKHNYGSILEGYFQKIYHLKNGMRILDDKVNQFSNRGPYFGSIQDDIDQRILTPVCKLIQFQKICQENKAKLRTFCYLNLPKINFKDNQQYSSFMTRIINEISQEQKAIKSQIEKINQQADAIFNLTEYPFYDNIQSKLAASSMLISLNIKMNQIFQIVKCYNIFAKQIFSIIPTFNFSYSNNMTVFNQPINFRPPVTKEFWIKNHDNCLQYLGQRLGVTFLSTLRQQRKQKCKFTHQTKIQSQIQRNQNIQEKQVLLEKQLSHLQVQYKKLRDNCIQVYKSLCLKDQKLDENILDQISRQNDDQIINKIFKKISNLQMEKEHCEIQQKGKLIHPNSDLFDQMEPTKDLIVAQAQLRIDLRQKEKEIQYLHYQLGKVLDKIQHIANVLQLSYQSQVLSRQQVSIFLLEQFTSKYVDASQEYHKLQTNSQEQLKNLNSIKLQNISLRNQLQKSQKEINNLSNLNASINQQILNMKNECINKENLLKNNERKKDNEIQQLRKLIEQQKVQKQLLNQKLLQQQKEISNQRWQLRRYQQRQSLSNDFIKEKNQKIDQLANQLKQIQQKKSQLDRIINQNSETIKTQHQNIIQLENTTRNLKSQLQHAAIYTLFDRRSSIYERQQLIPRVILQLQQIYSKISKLNKLFFFDSKNTQKSVIDPKIFSNHYNNLIVIKTLNKKIFIVFVMPPLRKSSERNLQNGLQKAFIMAYDDKQIEVYNLKQQKVTFEYNQMMKMMLIGKSDLRIHLDTAILHSNMGDSTSQFETGGKKGKMIIGSDQVGIETFEVYTIQFRQSQPTNISYKIEQKYELPYKIVASENIIKDQINYQKQTLSKKPNQQRLNQRQFTIEEVKVQIESIYTQTTKYFNEMLQKIQQNLRKHFQRQNSTNDQCLQFISSLRHKIKKFDGLLQEMKEKYEKLEKINMELENKLRNASTAQQSNNNNLQVQIKQLMGMNSQLKSKIDTLNNEFRAQNNKIKKLQSNLEESQSNCKNLQLQIETLNLKLTMNEENQLERSMEIERSNELQALKEKIKEKQYQINYLKQKEEDLIKTLQEENKNLNQELDKQKKIIEEHKMTINNNKNIKTVGKGFNEVELRESIFKQVTQKNQLEFQAYKHKLKKLFIQKYSHLLQKINEKDLDEFSLSYMDKLFQGQLLQQQIGLKYRLANILQKFTNCMIVKTRLVYKLDLKNKTNFHTYIDGIQNLLCIIKTVSNIYLAGFYTGVYHDKPMTDPGLLISLTNNDSYRLHVPDHTSRTNYRAMVYDPYFIIFGNAQLRIKTGESTMFSNFGINNSYYNVNNKKLQDFVGPENKRESEIISYEIYEVLFSNSSYYE